MKNKKNQFRQGDVLIQEIEIIPQNAKKTKQKLLVRGEGRNHGHFIIGNTEVLESNDQETEFYLNVKESSNLEHLNVDTQTSANEHKTIIIPPGNYKVIRQIEYNPYEKEIQKVQD